MVRAPSYDKNGVKTGAWSKEEDDKLRAYVERYGHWNWRELPRFAGLSRCGKSCRLRWVNYLKPNVKRGRYTKEEDELIIKLRTEFGSKWSVIARKLSGRTDNDIKNHWHTKLKKLATANPSTSVANDLTIKPSDSESETTIGNQPASSVVASVNEDCLSISESSQFPKEAFSSESSSSLSFNADLWEDKASTGLMEHPFADVEEDYFRTGPFIPDYTYFQPYNSPIKSDGEIFEFQFHNQLYEDNYMYDEFMY